MTKKRVHMSDIIKEINAELNRIKDAKLQVFLEVFLRPKITEAIKERKNRLTFSLAELEKMLHEVGLNEAKMSLDAAFTTKKEHFEYWYDLWETSPMQVRGFTEACYKCLGQGGTLQRSFPHKIEEIRTPKLLLEQLLYERDHNNRHTKTEWKPIKKEKLRKLTTYWWEQYSIVDIDFDLPFRWLSLLEKSGLSVYIRVEGGFYKSFNMERQYYREYGELSNLIKTDYTLLKERLIFIKNTLKNLYIEILWE